MWTKIESHTVLELFLSNHLFLPFAFWDCCVFFFILQIRNWNAPPNWNNVTTSETPTSHKWKRQYTKSYLDNLLNVSLALAFPLHHHWAMKSQKKLCWKGMQEAEILEILLILWTFDLKDGREHQQLLHSYMLIYSTQESEGKSQKEKKHYKLNLDTPNVSFLEAMNHHNDHQFK